MSVGYGWLWFIPLSPTRTSIGLVCPADYYKSSGLRPEELYRQAIQDDPLIRSLVETATPEGKFSTTKDWSFVADRMTGENWFLVGEALGFADPILAAGLTLTHASARECAFTILEANKLSLTSSSERTWLRDQYEQGNRRRVMQHIRFADYWYLANATFTDLKDYTREIARDAGLELDAERAFQWLGTGGFIEEDRGVGGIAAFGMAALLQISAHFSDGPFTCALDGYNMYHLTLKDAKPVKMARYSGGRVEALPALQRDGKFLPLHGVFGHIVAGLRQSPEASHLEKYLCREFGKFGVSYEAAQGTVFNCLEAMARDGWICCERSDNLPALEYPIPAETPAMGPNRDVRRSSARPPRN
jgi:hypothetical protein